MIRNISRNICKIVQLNAQSNQFNMLFSKYSLVSISNCQPTKFYFSAEQKVQSQQQSQQQPQQKKQKRQKRQPRQAQQTLDQFSPIDYYRNTIRKVNIRSNGKGQFSSYSLQKIINISKTQQHAKIMYEAYYNYMGHFTLIPNKVVDSLVFKSLQIGNLVDKVLEIYSSHNYLAYFPHYDATLRFFKHLIKNNDQQNLIKLFKILIRSPLIKINAKIVQLFLNHFKSEQCQPETKEYILKILLFRRNLIHELSSSQLLNNVATLLQSSQTGPFQAKPMIATALKGLLSQNSTSAQQNVNKAIFASTFELIEQSGAVLAQQTQQLSSEYERYFSYLINLQQRSSQQKNYGSILKQVLGQSKLSLNNAQKLQQLTGAGSA